MTSRADDCVQAAWIATRPEATNFGLLRLERARTVDDVLTLAPRVGIPGQNMVVGEPAAASPGRCSAACRAHRARTALFGPLEFRDGSDHPRIVDPPVGRLWTANQRVVDGQLEKCSATTRSTSAPAATTSARGRGRSATTWSH